ncbi:MAG: beta-glucosidase [Candidatus Riflebacteria bacterium]|nr:beta-glucosidase [Candidatus Riflebacteria bacterium]
MFKKVCALKHYFVVLLLLGVLIPSVSYSNPELGIEDNLILDAVQRQTLKYFWDFGHPVSGMAPERNTTPETVTTGGTGFGLMAWIVGIERGWLEREAVLKRANTLVDFLSHADRFHGAWPHWLNGSTGKVIPFWKYDDGADIVETSYLIQGLLCLRQYFNGETFPEKNLRKKINKLWHEVEWDWFTRNQNVLYWHWSPNFGWKMDHQIHGYNECLITYVLAASSPSHPIKSEVYHEGWATSSAFLNGKTYFKHYKLYLGEDWGGPLFFTQYSFLGIDPHKLSDQYADYWKQNVNHSMLNYLYCVMNPKHFKNYSKNCWGLTASDNYEGYSAHSPKNDLGVITPSAAISSIPYVPLQAMRAIKYFFKEEKENLWGDCGFYDSFCPEKNWYAKSFLAIDQGPIIVMIENYRSGLIWKLFMAQPEIRLGLKKLGFSSF